MKNIELAMKDKGEMDDSVRKVINDVELTDNKHENIEEIQADVSRRPLEIGNPGNNSKEKEAIYKNNFTGRQEQVNLDMKDHDEEMLDKRGEELDSYNLRKLDSMIDNINSMNIRSLEKTENGRLVRECEMLHPRRIINNHFVKYPCCSTNVGCIGWTEKSLKSEFDVEGIGVSMYFKFLKSLVILFSIITLLYIFVFYVFVSNRTSSTFTGYKQALFKSTIGNIGSFLYNCQKVPIVNLGVTLYNYEFDCGEYLFNSIDKFGLSKQVEDDLMNQDNCVSFTSDSKIRTKDCNLAYDLGAQIDSSCRGQNSCSGFANIALIDKTSCAYDLTVNSYIYLSYTCNAPWIKIGNWLVSRTTWSYILVALDFTTVFAILVTIILLLRDTARTKKMIGHMMKNVREYTVRIREVDVPNDAVDGELNDLVGHINRVLKEEKHLNIEHEEEVQINTTNKLNEPLLYEINYPNLSREKFNLLTKKEALVEKHNYLTKKINHFRRVNNDKKAENFEKNLQKVKTELGDVIIKTKEDTQAKYNVNDVFITFNKTKDADYFNLIYTKSKCTRCCLILCCKRDKIQHLYYKKRWLEVDLNPDDPSNIKWKNYTFNPCSRFMIKLCLGFVAFLIIMISFGVIIGGKYAQDQIAKTFPVNLDCSLVNYNTTLVLNELNSTSKQGKLNTYCYCYDLLLNNTGNIFAVQDNTLDNGVKPCDNWVDLYLSYQSATYGIIIIIPIINFVLAFVLKALTFCEKNKTISNDKSSNILKTFVSQFINTAVTIVIVNAYIEEVFLWNSSFPVFTGHYRDFDPGWYQDIGTTIIFSMILNIIIPHIANILGFIMISCRRYCDSKNMIGYKSKRETKKEFNALYLGPEFFIDIRISTILTYYMVMIIYSAGLPILYPCFLLFLFITFWVDKCLYTKLFRSPPQYDVSIIYLIARVLYVGLVFHLAIAIWIYGSPTLVGRGENSILNQINVSFITQMLQSGNYYSAEIIKRCTYIHTLIPLASLALLVAYVIFKYTIYELIILIFVSKGYKKIRSEKAFDPTVTEALPIRVLYKNYVFRMLTLRKLNKSQKDANVSDLKAYLNENIDNDRRVILNKLRQLTGNTYTNLERDFDSKIKTIIDGLNKEEDTMIKRDYSYNIGHIPRFESYYYGQLLND